MLHSDLLRRLCCARDLLRDWEDSPRSVSAVARATGFSRFHFIRLFKAVFGETPHQYRSRAQIEQAKHLLILTDWSVTEVCMALGFSSLGSFSALFSRRVGMSPSAFQRRHRPATGSARTPRIDIPITNENQTQQHHGRGSGQSARVLYPRTWLQEVQGHSPDFGPSSPYYVGLARGALAPALAGATAAAQRDATMLRAVTRDTRHVPRDT
jgi:AraC-like DNA-binding protein